MKRSTFFTILFLLPFFVCYNTFAQEVKNNKKDFDNKITKSPKGVDGVAVIGDKVTFKDGATVILEIKNEGSTGSILLPNAGTISPTAPTDKLYNNNGNLFWGSSQLGLAGGGVSAIDDLSDAIYDGLNLYIGNGAGANATAGGFNTAVGKEALMNNINSDNTAIGSEALKDQNGGAGSNTAVGRIALWKNIFGSSNTAIGKAALRDNTSANNNVAIGVDALLSNNNGENVAIGRSALKNATTGKGNIAIGYRAGEGETGNDKLYIENSSNITTPLIYGDFTNGSEQVKVNGDLYSVGRSYGGNFLASNNGGIGVYAVASDANNTLFQGNIGGSFQANAGEGIGVSGVAINSGALTNYGGSFTANGETGIGVRGYAGATTSTINYGGKFEAKGTAGYGIHAKAPTTGWAGYFDGNTAVSNKVFIGSTPQTPGAMLHIKQQTSIRAIRMEYDSDTDYWDTYIDGANDYNFGFNGTLKAFINDTDGAYVVSSDERLKNNIREMNNVLPSVLSLEPKRYKYNSDQTNKEQIGFVAQDVEKLFPEAVSEKDGYLGINYAVFGVLAIEALKEQQTKIDDLETRLARLESLINK